MVRKYSRQREAIKEFMTTRKDHPTADTVYMEVRKEFPNISLGTVYRNLTLLADMGEILRINVGDGTVHFDPDTSSHYHFICKGCGCVQDVELEKPILMSELVSKEFDGEIIDSVTYFHGMCKSCQESNLS